MKTYKNISVKRFNTFTLDSIADNLISFETEEEAVCFFKVAGTEVETQLILGGGSNLLFLENFNGTILHPEIKGIRTEEIYKDHITISAGAGVSWDQLVDWSVTNSYGGLENLSLIPGSVGASPVQNIGAYGVEVKDVIEKVRAVSTKDGSITEFSKNDCMFEYRNSIFKKSEKGKYLVTRVYFNLNIEPSFNLNYGSLKEEVERLGDISLANVRKAVISIRKSKLPDPEILGNAGSFFKNPIVDVSMIETIKNRYPQIPFFEDKAGSVKIAAGWLIDQCGWKGKRIGDAGVHDKQALVLVNYGNASGREIFDLSEKIRISVLEKFGIYLEREVEVVGAI